MQKVIIVYSIIYVVTFGTLLPFLCSSSVYSPYYMEFLTKPDDADKILLAANTRRREDSLNYLKTFEANQSRTWHLQQLSIVHLDVAVVVVTVDRSSFNNNPKFDHLTQTVTRLDQEIRDGNGLRAGLLVCNADPYPGRYAEASSLSSFYPTVQRTGGLPSPSVDVREIEKRDYVFCLRAALNLTAAPRFVLMVEDDAEPYPGMVTALSRLLLRRPFDVNSTLFLKLYYPERWSGFGWDPQHLMELIVVGFVTGTITASMVGARRWKGYRGGRLSSWPLWLHWLVAFVYGVTLALAIGRQHLIQLRRLVPPLISVREALDCCTPAVLFPAAVLDRVTRFLDGVNCSAAFGLDLALDQFAVDFSFRRYLVEPNLFHHRGFYSTLTKPKQRKEFLFDV